MEELILIITALIFVGCKDTARLNPFYTGTQLDSIDIKNEKYNPKMFHVKVAHFYNESYCVKYTIDNWQTEKSLMEAFDLEYKDIPVSYQEKLFQNLSCEKAISNAVQFARGFKTYEDCLKYNTSTRKKYWALLEYRKVHPIIEKAIIDKKEVCTKEVSVL